MKETKVAKWVHQIDLKEVWEEANSKDEMEIEDIGKVLEVLLPQLSASQVIFPEDEQLTQIIESFNYLKENIEIAEIDSEELLEDFNVLFSKLYDWGDARRVWVGTF